MATILSDSPIDVPDDDLLGRDPFAKTIAEIINNAPPHGSLRIGVFAGWGEGKTSILKLVSEHLRTAGQVCVWITPWVFSSREEVISHLLDEIANELEISTKALKAAKRSAQVTDQLREATGVNIKFKLADILIGEALKGYYDKKAKAKGQTLITAIEKALGDRRLTIFIDDLDRVRPDMVPDLLLTLREALDYPNYFYVMALAPDVIELGLSMMHKGWGEPRQFLEKIIELPMHLPKLTPQQVELYAQELINSLGADIDQEAIKDLFPLFHRNPRRLKLFLRYLASLHGLFSRFDPYEVDWRVLYICLMLRYEFPEQIRKLMLDDKAVKDIEAGYMKERFEKLAPKGLQENGVKEGLPESKYAPKGNDEKKRFIWLFNAIRERGLVRGRYRLPKLFGLADDPPILTLKEINDEINHLNGLKPEERLDDLREWLTANKSLEKKKVQAFVDGLIEIRNSHLELTADAKLEEDVKIGLKIPSLITEIIRYVSIDLGGFKDSILNSENWLNILKHFAHWAHFRRFDYYEEVRGEERQLLKETAAEMPTHVLVEILESREVETELRFFTEEKGFKETVWEIMDEGKRRLSESLIDAFRSPNGMEAFWAIDFYVKGKNLLFDKKSHFHTNSQIRSQLAKISSKAKQNAEIQLNFLTYFRMLCHGAYGQGGSFPQSECQELLKDSKLLKLVWDAAVAQPLNPRMAGDLYRHRRMLLERGIDENLLATPDWWDRLEDTGFFQSIE